MVGLGGGERPARGRQASGGGKVKRRQEREQEGRGDAPLLVEVMEGGAVPPEEGEQVHGGEQVEGEQVEGEQVAKRPRRAVLTETEGLWEDLPTRVFGSNKPPQFYNQAKSRPAIAL